MPNYDVPDEQTFKRELKELGFPEPVIDEAYNRHKSGIAHVQLSPERAQATLDAIAAEHPELFKKEPTLFERIRSYLPF